MLLIYWTAQLPQYHISSWHQVGIKYGDFVQFLEVYTKANQAIWFWYQNYGASPFADRGFDDHFAQYVLDFLVYSVLPFAWEGPKVGIHHFFSWGSLWYAKPRCSPGKVENNPRYLLRMTCSWVSWLFATTRSHVGESKGLSLMN